MNPNAKIILIVGALPGERDRYGQYLAQDPDYTYEFLEASTASHALDLWQNQAPDVVLLHSDRPPLDILSWLTQAQASRPQPDLPVVVIIAPGCEAIAAQAMRAGAQDYLVEGQITPAELYRAVRRAIAPAQRYREFQQRLEAERKQAEMALRDSEEQLRLSMQVTGYALARVDYATGTVQLSPEAAVLYGFPGQSVVTREQIHSTFHPDERDALMQQIAGVLDPLGEGWFADEHRVVWQTGEVRWLTVRKQVFFERSGAAPYPTHALLVALDISDRKQVELERERLLQQEQAARTAAEQANRVKDEFLAMLSHELRTPLTPILGWTKLLQTVPLDPPTIAEALETIERNVSLQTQLIDDLLDVAKILRGKMSLNPAPVNLKQTVEAALDTLKTAAFAKSIQVHTALENVGQVSGDPVRLQQIFWNLLSNAIKFTPPGGKVTIILVQVDEYAEVTVQDTGKGIRADFLPYLFESFRQEDVSVTRSYGGLGLGLAIVRYLVEAHGGTVRAASPGLERGATFTVQLPLLKLRSEILSPFTATPQSPDLAQVRVLSVEDDPDTRHFIEILLQQYGAEVMAVATADEALKMLGTFHPDILISDIGMPGMDGYTLLQKIRDRAPEQGGKIPAIALTAYAREDDQQRVVQAGYQAHVPKPIDPQTLIQTILNLAHS